MDMDLAPLIDPSRLPKNAIFCHQFKCKWELLRIRDATSTCFLDWSFSLLDHYHFPLKSIHVTEKWGFWPSRKILCLDILRPNVHPLSFIPSLVFAAHPYAHAWDGIMSVIDMLTVNKHSPCSKDKTNGPRSSSTIQDKSSEKEDHRYLPDVINAIWTLT